MRAGIRFFVLCALLSIPWQAVFILKTFTIGNPAGIWQYGTIGIFPFDGAIFLALLCASIERMKSGRLLCDVMRWKEKAVLFCFLLFFGVGALSLVHAPHVMAGVVVLLRIAEGGLIVFLIREYGISQSSIARALCVGGVGEAILGILQFISQTVPAVPWLGIAYHSATVLGDSVVEFGDERWLRAYGTFAHPNVFGFYLGAAYLATLYLYQKASSARIRLLFLGVANVILIALFFSFSREAWISLAVVACVTHVLLWIANRKKEKVQYGGIHPIVMLGITHVLVIGCLMIPFRHLVEVRVGIGGMTRLENKSIEERVGGIGYSLNVIRNTFGKGVGVAQSTAYHAQEDARQKKEGPAYLYQPVHNTYVLIVEEVGMFGMLLVVLFLGARARMLWSKKFPLLQTQYFIFASTAALFDHFFWTLAVGPLVWLLLLFLPTQEN